MLIKMCLRCSSSHVNAVGLAGTMAVDLRTTWWQENTDWAKRWQKNEERSQTMGGGNNSKLGKRNRNAEIDKPNQILNSVYLK